MIRSGCNILEKILAASNFQETNSQWIQYLFLEPVSVNMQLAVGKVILTIKKWQRHCPSKEVAFLQAVRSEQILLHLLSQVNG